MMLKVKQAKFRIQSIRERCDDATNEDLDIIEAGIDALLEELANQANVIQQMNTNFLEVTGKLLDAEAEIEQLKNKVD